MSSPSESIHFYIEKKVRNYITFIEVFPMKYINIERQTRLKSDFIQTHMKLGTSQHCCSLKIRLNSNIHLSLEQK